MLENVRLSTCITKVRSGFDDSDGKISRFVASLTERYPVELFFIAPSCSNIGLRQRIECRRSTTSFDVVGMLGSALGKKRHPTLLPKMVDSGTTGAIACEVPVWYDKTGRGRAKIDVLATDSEGSPTIWGPDRFVGHIDVLSMDEKGHAHIWDYKPDAVSEKKAAAQLTFYAIALSDCAGIPFQEITCHYFDEKDTFSFKPSELSFVTADFVEPQHVFIDLGEVTSKSSRAKCNVCRKTITDPTRREISAIYRGRPIKLCYHLTCSGRSELVALSTELRKTTTEKVEGGKR